MKPIRKLADAAKSGLRAQNWPFPAKLDGRKKRFSVLRATTGAVRDRANVEIRYARIEFTRRQSATDTSRTDNTCMLSNRHATVHAPANARNVTLNM